MSDAGLTTMDRGEDLEKELQGLLKLLSGGFEEVLEQWGETVYLPSVVAHWGEQANWPPLADSTLKEKARLGEPSTPLIRTRENKPHLFASATTRGATGNIFEAGPFDLTVGVSEEVFPYADRHYERWPWYPEVEGSGSPEEKALDRMIEDEIDRRLESF